MEYSTKIPFKVTNVDQLFTAILLSEASSLLSIVADNPFGTAPAYYAGISRFDFVKSVLAGNFSIPGRCLSESTVNVLQRLLDEPRSPLSAKAVWATFVETVVAERTPSSTGCLP